MRRLAIFIPPGPTAEKQSRRESRHPPAPQRMSIKALARDFRTRAFGRQPFDEA